MSHPQDTALLLRRYPIRERDDASDISQERVDETTKREYEWIGLDREQLRNTPIEFNRGALWAERYLKEKNAS